jgi:hypothetical protein
MMMIYDVRIPSTEMASSMKTKKARYFSYIILNEAAVLI